MFERNYPNILSTLYTNQVPKKQKITFDVKEVRKRFVSGDSLIDYFGAVLNAVYDGIARTEYQEMLETWVAYYFQYNIPYFTASTPGELPATIGEVMLNMTVPSTKYNQASTPEIPLTLQSNLSDIYILTTSSITATISGSIYPQYFDTGGIDFRERILTIDEFPKVHTLTADYTLVAADITALSHINYMLKVGTIIPKDSIIPQSWIDAGFLGTVTTLAFDNQDFGFVFDRGSIRYAIDEGAGWAEPFRNGEYLQTNMWYHYTSLKAISPFYNKACFGIGPKPTKV
jgi:hypothetical protein